MADETGEECAAEAKAGWKTTEFGATVGMTGTLLTMAQGAEPRVAIACIAAATIVAVGYQFSRAKAKAAS